MCCWRFTFENTSIICIYFSNVWLYIQYGQCLISEITAKTMRFPTNFCPPIWRYMYVVYVRSSVWHQVFRQLPIEVKLFSTYANEKNGNKCLGFCISCYQSSSLSMPCGTNVLCSFIKTSSVSPNFSLSVSVSLDVVFIFLHCSIIMICHVLLNVWILLLNCLHAFILYGFSK